MQQNSIYEYAIVRIVPLVEREEFLNCGVILLCKKEKYLRMVFLLREERILFLSPEADIVEIRKNLEAFRKITAGDVDGGPIARLDEPERFRWLTAVRSTSIQTSRPHPGISSDLDKTLDTLFAEMVG